jgi:hypothetical protein
VEKYSWIASRLLARVAKHGLAIALHVLIEPNARSGLDQDYPEPGLAAFQRITPEIVAVQLDQVESV